jgi:hypothetical protein
MGIYYELIYGVQLEAHELVTLLLYVFDSDVTYFTDKIAGINSDLRTHISNMVDNNFCKQTTLICALQARIKQLYNCDCVFTFGKSDKCAIIIGITTKFFSSHDEQPGNTSKLSIIPTLPDNLNTLLSTVFSQHVANKIKNSYGLYLDSLNDC